MSSDGAKRIAKPSIEFPTTWASWFAYLILIVLTVVLFYLVYLSFEIALFIRDGFLQLEPTQYVPILVTLFAAALALGGTLLTQYLIRNRSIEEAHRDKKVETYSGFLNLVRGVILSTKPGFEDRTTDENEMIEKMLEFGSEITLWSSPDVLRAFNNFKTASGKNPTPYQMFQAVDNLYRAMRRDIGLSNRGLEADFFIKMQLSDPEELDKLRSSVRQ